MSAKLLDLPPKVALRGYVDLLRTEGVDADAIARMATALIAFYGSAAADRDALRATVAPFLEVERRWYDSLERGEPDFGVYDDPVYLADLWACWVLYSRRYLRELRRAGLLDGLGGVVADLGCGVGLASAALAELLPGATVYGTNVEGVQARLARRVGERYGFTVLPHPPSRADVVFASEYFEHFLAPVAHLRDVLAAGPSTLFIASTFGPRSTGHFDEYVLDGESVSPKQASRAFDAELVDRGYVKVATGLWNGRPTVWRAS